MNAVVIAVCLMLLLSFARVNVVIALTISSVVAGLFGGLALEQTISAFNDGLGGGAQIALSYALLGAFAAALSQSGIATLVSNSIIKKLGKTPSSENTKWLRSGLLFAILAMAVSSQNILPIHIAFIPILIPPLLLAISALTIDRRLIACLITFGLVTTYMILPVGFGAIFLNDVLLAALNSNGLEATSKQIPQAMLLPALGMLSGLFIAVFFSYRKPREYQQTTVEGQTALVSNIDKKSIFTALAAIVITLAVQLYTGSMIFGALSGFIILNFSGILKKTSGQDLFNQGVLMMANIGFIMIAAAGFAEVIKSTGEVSSLVTAIGDLIGDNKALAAMLMLVVGLIITMGIGSSFSTVPVIATIYVPLALSFDFSIAATIALVGTAAALGDAGSPASDSTLGPTAGLNVDGQHDHIKDSVIPTFIHFNIPLLIFGWIAAMVL
ncbi:Na+/H+ antiporter family protein [Thalassotalea sp. PLHSN55]|uniref:Na+/H+ antiporter family protein n=1 Tax=Thalassotalea sp. PLHSN55 TaxID=3435888 RepID=UPI003F874E5D